EEAQARELVDRMLADPAQHQRELGRILADLRSSGLWLRETEHGERARRFVHDVAAALNKSLSRTEGAEEASALQDLAEDIVSQILFAVQAPGGSQRGEDA